MNDNNRTHSHLIQPTHHTQSHFCTESPTYPVVWVVPTHNMQYDLQPPPTGNFTTVSIIVSKSLRQLPKTPLA